MHCSARIVAASLLVLAGVAPVSAATKEACTLISKADVGQIFGESFGDPEGDVISAGGPASVSQCLFHTGTRVPGQVASVKLEARYSSAPNRGAPGVVRETMITMGEHPINVPGLGDTALWGTRQSGVLTIGELNIFRGNTIYLVVTVDGRADDATLKQAKALGALALSHI